MHHFMKNNRLFKNGFPKKQGLYNPANEHDACGVGFVVNIAGTPSNDIVQKGFQILNNLSHRGASGCDPCTGDGAGILIQIPHAFFKNVVTDFDLPEQGTYGVGMVFLPNNAKERESCERLFETIADEQGQQVLGWRTVPVNTASLGETAKATLPTIRQIFIAKNQLDSAEFERRLYLIRKQVEGALRKLPMQEMCYVVSLSSRTIVYKGLLLPFQIPLFYEDFADASMESALALVHSRFSTNTFPTWPLSHPYRYICHNGEINTLQGNINWMRARQGQLHSPLFGADIKKLYPIIAEQQSDSACLDNAVEFLVMGGRSLPHAMMMLIPEAWSADPHMDLDRRAFYEYHAAMMEPWDGPAAVAFTDGIQIGATLDRNGLRPGRFMITKGGLAVLSSEAGVLPFAPEEIIAKGRLQPGKMFLVDTRAGKIIDDEEIKAELSSRRPYRQWVSANRIRIEELPDPTYITQPDHITLRQRQQVFGYTIEDLKILMTPMAVTGEEAIGSMGTDTPLAILSERPALLFKYFKQLFAQVTNPPIDPIREQLVMSLATSIGPKANLLGETPEHARRIRISTPILTNSDLEKIRSISASRNADCGSDDNGGHFKAKTIPILFVAAEGAAGMAKAIEKIYQDAISAIADKHNFIILSDRGVNETMAPIPSLLAISAVHHYLIREGVRSTVGLSIETGEAREVSHFALLIGYGAGSINPYLAFETLVDMGRDGYLPETIDEATAEAKYIKAVDKGLLKIISKMGISTIQSYCGSQIFEAVGLHSSFIDCYFAGTSSRIGGGGIDLIAEEVIRRHQLAYHTPLPARQLDYGGEYNYRIQGEHHNWNPETIYSLQHATQKKNDESYKAFSQKVNDESRHSNLRGLLQFKKTNSVPLAGDVPLAGHVALSEVEPASEIVKRFATGAMSFGSISKEAHEMLAVAMNTIGGRSNTGEGGEAPERYGTIKNSAIKQVASARFGVTTDYLVHAKELQIKVAQGAKPGEGGQLPGAKVDEVIAKTRFSTPGVTLISPPPHHDIYSIEDLAQLIFDLKNVNSDALVTVKLVSEVGVGTIAAGVAKAHADLILISGDSGGTGASPQASIKHAGTPWELGLAETQQTLVLNNLRGRTRLQVDGQLKTGRDVVIAALLGAEEFGFSTAPLIVLGCIMMRKCHLNTCPVGIATQDPVLRKKFTGQEEHLINYFFYVAEEVREIMASLGFRKMDDMVGRVDLLEADPMLDHWKAKGLDLSAMLHKPIVAPNVATHCVIKQDHGLADALDHQLIASAKETLLEKKCVSGQFQIQNINRTVGAMLSGEIARRFGQNGLEEDTIQFQFTGSAGQSFGAFCVKGVTLNLIGEANDYVGKGLCGGKLIISPPEGTLFVPEETIIIGNTSLYGATSGELYVYGMAGERFAVRNSGATAVIEGVGDHGCEYMTGGVVVVLGKTGRNFAAGMSGGMAFVLNEENHFEKQCNLSLVALEKVVEKRDQALLKELIERHAQYTKSQKAKNILKDFDQILPHFVKVISVEYKKVLQQRERISVFTPIAKDI
jgi:glutamate synthase (NADPH/NADH) large chain/glutamate synthase (ferredoxin)